MTEMVRVRGYLLFPVVLLFVLLVLVGCGIASEYGTNLSPPGSQAGQLQSGLMDPGDLPLGWSRASSGTPRESLGGTGMWVKYHPTRGALPFVKVDQEILVFADESQSNAAYDARVSKTFPEDYRDKWIWPSELGVLDQADESAVGCLPLQINSIRVESCVAIARYGVLLTTISGNVFEDRQLTETQFRSLLQRLDGKLAR